MYIYTYYTFYDRRKFSLEVKLPTTWTDGKAEVEEKKREDQRRKRVGRKKTQVREKVAKLRSTVCFQ